MRISTLVITSLAISAVPAVAQKPPGMQAGALTAQSDLVVLGKVTGIEKDEVQAPPFPTVVMAGPDGKALDKPPAKIAFRIAVLKIDESIVGGKGLTQVRVGWPAGGATGGLKAAGFKDSQGIANDPFRYGKVALTAETEGCFFLARHHNEDFYVLTAHGNGAPLSKKDKDYDKELAEVRRAAKVLEDPVTALKSKELDDRFHAAQVILRQYQTGRPAKYERVPIPAEENKLIIDLLLELPWWAKDANPHRDALWSLIGAYEIGFRPPKAPAEKSADPHGDYLKRMEQATTTFLKENKDKIKIRRYVR